MSYSRTRRLFFDYAFERDRHSNRLLRTSMPVQLVCTGRGIPHCWYRQAGARQDGGVNSGSRELVSGGRRSLMLATGLSGLVDDSVRPALKEGRERHPSPARCAIR